MAPRRDTRAAALGLALIALLASRAGAQTFDRKDVALYAAAESRAAASLGTRFAVVVGIDQYEHRDSLATLRFAEKDARDVATALEDCGFLVTLMTPGRNPSPWSAEAILGEVAKMCNLANTPDTILFYFSGHGFSAEDKTTYICSYNSHPDRLQGSAVLLSEIDRRLRTSKARKRVMIADACRNVPGKSGGGPALSLLDFQKAEGTGHLFSTAPGFKSFEPDSHTKDLVGRDMVNGIFTHFFLHGIRGDADENADRCVTFREIAYRVDADLQRWSMLSGQTQKPFLLWDGGAGDDVLLRVLAETTAPAVAYQKLAWADPKPGTTWDAKTGLPREVIEKTIGMELVLVPAGTFMMGSTPSSPLADGSFDPREHEGHTDKKTHRVTLSRPFYIGKYEVTNAQYREFKPSHQSAPEPAKRITTTLDFNADDQPAVLVSWEDAVAFGAKFGFRLPTSAEWEYACRARTTTRYVWGDAMDQGSGWANLADRSIAESELQQYRRNDGTVTWNDGYVGPARVGKFRPNALKIHDMVGNVAEWCADWYSDDPYEAYGAEVIDPRGPTSGSGRMKRGGSWSSCPCQAASGRRNFLSAEHPICDEVGFRVVRNP